MYYNINMSLLIKKHNAKISLEITNDINDTVFDTSLANAIRRTLYLSCFCYGIPEEVSNEQKIIFNDLFHVNYEDKEKIFSVSASNYLNIEALSHRLNRMPLYYDAANEYLYKQGLFICLTEDNNYSKPYVHKNIEPRLIYSKDLTYLTLISGVLTKLTEEEKNSIIKYNIHLYSLKYDNSIHIISSPMFNCGYEGSEFEPVTVSYNFGLDAKPDYHRRDVFDNPDNIYLTIAFSGKKDVTTAWNDSLIYLSNQINIFITEYIKATTSESDVVKIIPCEFNVQEIDIYNADCYLADHTMGNLISCQVLMDITNLLYQYVKENEDLFHELYSQILVSYIAPDESAITRMIKIKFQIPLDVGFNDFIIQSYSHYFLTGSTLIHNTKLCILYHTSLKLMNYLKNEII